MPWPLFPRLDASINMYFVHCTLRMRAPNGDTISLTRPPLYLSVEDGRYADIGWHVEWDPAGGQRDVCKLYSALLAARARGALGAGQNMSCQTFKASCFGFGGSSTAFTVSASIA